MPLSLLGAGLLTLASAACSQAVDGSHDEGDEFAADEVVGGVEVNPDAAVQGQPEAEITINGRKLQLVGPITEPFPARSTDAQFKESSGSRPLSTYTLDELALGMRPIVVRDGYFYSTDEPDYELATKVMEQMHEVNGTETTPPREGRLIIGTTDDRSYDGANTTGWRRALMFSEIGCTATMISPSVALTAGHCVFNTVSDVGYTVKTEPPATGTRSPRWASAVDGRDADPHPINAPYQSYEVNCNAIPVGPTSWTDSNGNFAASPGTQNYSPNCTSSTTTQPGPWIGCYTAVIHDNYRNATSQTSSTAFDWDFALIDFSTCGNQPGNYAGFVGVQTLSETDIEAANGNVWGFPGATGVPGVTSGAQKYTSRVTKWWSGSPTAWEEGEIWGMGGAVTLDSSTAVRLKYSFDTSGGQSGSLVWRTLSGVMVGYGDHFGSSGGVNQGRRFDSSVLTHATSFTVYPN